MPILNFDHELTHTQRAQIRAYTGKRISHIKDYAVQFGDLQSFSDQLQTPISQIPRSYLHASSLLLNLPSLNYIVAGVLVYLHGILLLGIEFLVAPIYVAYLASLGDAAASSAGMMVSKISVTFALRLLLVFLGSGILGVFILHNAAFALVLISEVLGRFLFYATDVLVGI